MESATLPSNKKVYKQLLQIRDYRHLLLAGAASRLGDQVYALGLIWAMKLLTGDSLLMSLVIVAEIIPFVLLGLIAGTVVDMRGKRLFLVSADIVRGMIVLAITILWWTNGLLPWMLIVAAVLLSTCSAFFSPAQSSIIRSVVPPVHMQSAMSFNQTITNTINLVAIPLAGLLLATDVGYTFLLNTISFCVSLLFILLIPKHAYPSSLADVKLNLATIATQLKIGIQVILNHTLLRTLILYMALINLLLSPISLLIPLYAQSSNHLALLEFALVLGTVVGAVIVGLRLIQNLPHIASIVFGLVSVLISFGVISFIHQISVEVICMFMAGVGIAIANVKISSLFITIVPMDIIGRAVGAVNVVLHGSRPLSLLMTGTILGIISVNQMFLSIAILGLFVVLLLIMNPALRTREEAAEQNEAASTQSA